MFGDLPLKQQEALFRRASCYYYVEPERQR